MTIKARVTAGRLVVDEPTDLPEGVEPELLPLDPGDWLDDADREALHEALTLSRLTRTEAISMVRSGWSRCLRFYWPRSNGD